MMKTIVAILLVSMFLLTACTSGNQKIPPVIDICASDSECVPLPSCHPKECINKNAEHKFEKPEACTELFDCSAAYNDNDCICQDARCVNKNADGSACEEFY